MTNLSGLYDEHAEADAFDPIPAGEYRARIIQADKEDISKRHDYGECLNLTWEIEGGEHDRRLVWQRLNLWAENMNKVEKVRSIANSSFAAIRQATGVLTPQNTDELLHIPCLIQVSIRTDPNGQYDPQNEIKRVKALPSNGAMSGGGQVSPAPNRPGAAQALAQGSTPWAGSGDVPF